MENIYTDTNEERILTKLFGQDRQVSFSDVLDKLEERDDDANFLESKVEDLENEIYEIKERLLRYEQ